MARMKCSLEQLKPVSVTLTTTSEATLIAAPASNLAIVVFHISASNTSATPTRLDVKEGAGGTIRLSHALGASGGGFEEPMGEFWELAPATALIGILGTAVTDVRVNIKYGLVLA